MKSDNREDEHTSPKSSGSLSEHSHRIKSAIIKLLILSILVIVISRHPLERTFTELLSPAVGSSNADDFYLLLLIPIDILAAYFVYRIYVTLTTPIIEVSLAKLKVRTATSAVLLLNKILGVLLLVTTAIWLLSSRISFLSGYVEGVVASFSGLFSLLFTLIVAMQMKEVGGNFIAGMLLRGSDVVDEGDYIKMDSEYVRVEKIDHSYTRVVNILGERIFIPNFKFLTDNFRKPYSKQNREYVDLRFDASYEYSPKQLEQDMSDLVNQYNQTPNRTVKIDEFIVVTIDLAPYSVIYELRVKPSAPIFPEAIRSDFRRLLHEKYGEDLATPMLLNIRK